MKDLLTNIVDKMNTNQTEKSSSASVTSDEAKSSRGSSVSLFYILLQIKLVYVPLNDVQIEK
jgi:hypothetical protein